MIKVKSVRSNLLVMSLIVVFAFSLAEAKEYGDIYMDATRDGMEKAEVGAVVFPHWFHRIRYKCKVCHESIFVMRKGANNANMNDIMDGKSCGVCHNGQIAWEPLECERCHSAEFKPKADEAASNQ